MNEIFQAIFNMSITGTYIFAAIIILRLCIKKLPRKYSYILWSILGIRLLCPISFSSVISLFNILKPQVVGGEMTFIPQDIKYTNSPNVNVGVPAINNAVNNSLPAADTASSVTPMQIILSVAAIIWLIGIGAMLIYSIISYAAVRKRVSSATVLQDNVYLCEKLEVPFVYGIIKPKIYIPSSVSAADLDFILAHERVHISRGDHIIKLIAFAALTLHWFNPFVWISFKLMTNDMEHSCDEKALTKFQGDVKRDYASALLNISMKQNKLSCGGLLSFGESNIKSRIKGIIAAKKPTVIASVVAAAAVIIAAICLLTNPQSAQEGSLLTNIVNSDYNSYVLIRGNEERKFAFEEIKPLMDKLYSTKHNQIDSRKLSFFDGGYNLTVMLYTSENNYTGLDFLSALDENGDEIFCVSILTTNVDYTYRISEADWFEISKLFNGCFDGNLDSLQTTAITHDVTQVIPQAEHYDSETALCEAYITAYITSIFSNGDSFYPELYCSSVSETLSYTSLANQYDRNIYNSYTLSNVTVLSDNAEITELEGFLYLRIPYTVDYQADSGFGRTAYFQIESTDNGFKVYQALMFTPADFYAIGLDEKSVIDADVPIEFGIKSAIAALAASGNNADETIVTDTDNFVNDNMFTAVIVEETNSGLYIAKPIEGEWELSSCDRFYITAESGLKQGELVNVEYNGMIMETSPAQIQQTTIELLTTQSPDAAVIQYFYAEDAVSSKRDYILGLNVDTVSIGQFSSSVSWQYKYPPLSESFGITESDSVIEAIVNYNVTTSDSTQAYSVVMVVISNENGFFVADLFPYEPNEIKCTVTEILETADNEMIQYYLVKINDSKEIVKVYSYSPFDTFSVGDIVEIQYNGHLEYGENGDNRIFAMR